MFIPNINDQPTRLCPTRIAPTILPHGASVIRRNPGSIFEPGFLFVFAVSIVLKNDVDDVARRPGAEFWRIQRRGCSPRLTPIG
ncbi:hypothetical protein RSSM_03941 [Rhodopirellula sallentina SM41]|uniref:Uncharacterized protein n=1 Tax=Rhodopirellula sallentina SM41 TaxID=1263870 RepID=M5TZZ8_9BACT|nr:hypothetical protein RSSM_03941 [Rhodopirellula sallentina SM41]